MNVEPAKNAGKLSTHRAFGVLSCQLQNIVDAIDQESERE